MEDIHALRLLNVARALEESQIPEAFCMGFYGYATRDYNAHSRHDEHPCGTPGCALGHYAARRDLQQAFILGQHNDILRTDGTDYHAYYDGAYVLDHFGIDEQDARILFGENGCGDAQTAGEAARFIRAYVAARTAAEA